MYVDKKLSGVKAVQTLSRLNRTCPCKEGTFVLDFANEGQTILDSFQPFYEVTTVKEETVVAIHGEYDSHPADVVEKPLSESLSDFKMIRLEKGGHVPWKERQARHKFFQANSEVS